MNFSEMHLNPKVLHGLEDMGIISPTPIQKQSITKFMEFKDSHIIAQAKTGSGKTLAYAIPIVNQLKTKNKHVQALVMVPTRELCKQVAAVFNDLSKYKKIKIIEVYGGVSIRNQIEKIRNGAQIVIATPGRLLDLYRRRQIGFRYIKNVVLDEADRMLDMGFIPDISYLLLEAMQNMKPRLILFSATLASQIRDLVDEFTGGENQISIDISSDSALTVDNCRQSYYLIKHNKYWNFVKIIAQENPEYSIIFTRTKANSIELYEKLRNEEGLNIKPAYINGDLTQHRREKIIEKFRNREINCLIGTDVLARGLDFPRVSHVFNYDMPESKEDYVHRIGRTARVEGVNQEISQGNAISLVSRKQQRLLRDIERYINVPIKKERIAEGAELGIKRKKNISPIEFVKISKERHNELYGNEQKERKRTFRIKSNKRDSQGSKSRFDDRRKNKRYRKQYNKQEDNFRDKDQNLNRNNNKKNKKAFNNSKNNSKSKGYHAPGVPRSIETAPPFGAPSRRKKRFNSNSSRKSSRKHAVGKTS